LQEKVFNEPPKCDQKIKEHWESLEELNLLNFLNQNKLAFDASLFYEYADDKVIDNATYYG